MTRRRRSRPLAAAYTRDTVAVLRALMQARGVGLRQLCRYTAHLPPPERIHHTALSNILLGRPWRRLGLQQLLAILRLLGVQPVEFFQAVERYRSTRR